jgi:hypothetical protein
VTGKNFNLGASVTETFGGANYNRLGLVRFCQCCQHCGKKYYSQPSKLLYIQINDCTTNSKQGILKRKNSKKGTKKEKSTTKKFANRKIGKKKEIKDVLGKKGKNK